MDDTERAAALRDLNYLLSESPEILNNWQTLDFEKSFWDVVAMIRNLRIF